MSETKTVHLGFEVENIEDFKKRKESLEEMLMRSSMFELVRMKGWPKSFSMPVWEECDEEEQPGNQLEKDPTPFPKRWVKVMRGTIQIASG